MGLTGVIVSASIRLRPLPGPLLSVDTDRGDVPRRCSGPARRSGRRVPRGVAGPAGSLPDPRDRHPRVPPRRGSAREAPARVRHRRRRLTVPGRWPDGLLRPGLVRAYNAYRFAGPRVAGPPPPSPTASTCSLWMGWRLGRGCTVPRGSCSTSSSFPRAGRTSFPGSSAGCAAPRSPVTSRSSRTSARPGTRRCRSRWRAGRSRSTCRATPRPWRRCSTPSTSGWSRPAGASI